MSDNPIAWNTETSTITGVPHTYEMILGTVVEYEIRPLDDAGEVVKGIADSIVLVPVDNESLEYMMDISETTFNAEKNCYIITGRTLQARMMNFTFSINDVSPETSRIEYSVKTPWYKYYVQITTEPMGGVFEKDSEATLILSLQDENGTPVTGLEDELRFTYTDGGPTPDYDPFGFKTIKPVFKDEAYHFKLKTDTGVPNPVTVSPFYLNEGISEYQEITVTESFTVYDKTKSSMEVLPYTNLYERSGLMFKVDLKDEDGEFVNIEEMQQEYLFGPEGVVPNPKYKPVALAVFWYDENKQPIPGKYGQPHHHTRMIMSDNGSLSTYYSETGLQIGDIGMGFHESRNDVLNVPSRFYVKFGVGMRKNEYDPISMPDLSDEFVEINVTEIEEKGGVYSDIHSDLRYEYGEVAVELKDEEGNPIEAKVELITFIDTLTGEPSKLPKPQVNNGSTGIFFFNFGMIPDGVSEYITFAYDGKQSQQKVYLRGYDLPDTGSLEMSLHYTSTEFMVGSPFNFYTNFSVGNSSGPSHLEIEPSRIRIEAISDNDGVEILEVTADEIIGVPTKPTSWTFKAYVDDEEIKVHADEFTAGFLEDSLYKVDKIQSKLKVDSDRKPSPIKVDVKLVDMDGQPLNIPESDIGLYRIGADGFIDMLASPMTIFPQPDTEIDRETLITNHVPEEGIYRWTTGVIDEILLHSNITVGYKTSSDKIEILPIKCVVTQVRSLAEEVDLVDGVSIKGLDKLAIDRHFNLEMELKPKKGVVTVREHGLAHKVSERDISNITNEMIKEISILDTTEQKMSFLNLYLDNGRYDGYSYKAWVINYQGKVVKPEVSVIGVRVSGKLANYRGEINIDPELTKQTLSSSKSKMEVKP